MPHDIYTHQKVNATMASRPDDFTFNFRGSDPQEFLDQGRIVVYDETDLFDYLVPICGGVAANSTVRHELAHKNTANTVGLPFSFYSITPNDHICTVEIHYGEAYLIPRLAIGAIALAPLDPSRVDYQTARNFGYSSLKNVGERVVAWNASRGNSTSPKILIPAPLGYRPSLCDLEKILS